MKLLSLWISDCDDNHSCSQRLSDFFPTRVIDVGEPGQKQQFTDNEVRLVYQTKDIEQSSNYLALSHRWGSIPSPGPAGSNEPRDMVRTTVKADLVVSRHQQQEQQQQGRGQGQQGQQEQARKERNIELSQLPRTFRDAVLVARGLGVRYLWIDSLCIVQDDEQDWQRESQMMERVYTSAYCTIAAVRAGRPDDGFLSQSPLPSEGDGLWRGEDRDVVVVVEGAGGGDKKLKVPGDEVYVCEMLDDFDEHVGRSELQRRGWVLQERALSRRTIYFTDKQTYWECGKGIRCETFTKMHKYVFLFPSFLPPSFPLSPWNELTSNYSEKAAFLGDSDFPRYGDAHSKGKRIKFIQSFYEQYSAMQLTYAKDRPAAIRGLEARLVQTIGGPGGYGVFRKHMHRYLLWKRCGKTSLERIADFPPNERVPSWSWMAYAGPIEYVDVPGYNVEWEKNLIWPYSESDPVPSRLEAPVRDISQLQADEITLDDGRPMITLTPKCVVVGTVKVPADVPRGYEKYCHVLIVEPVTTPVDGINEGGRAWQRLGVGRLQLQHIVFEQEGRGLDLNWII
jgi:hypothetical protein